MLRQRTIALELFLFFIINHPMRAVISTQLGSFLYAIQIECSKIRFFSSRYTFTQLYGSIPAFSLVLVLAHKGPISQKVAFMTVGVKRKYNASCTMIFVCMPPFFLGRFLSCSFLYDVFTLSNVDLSFCSSSCFFGSFRLTEDPTSIV